MKKHLLSYAALIILTACYPTVDHRGFNPEQAEKLQELVINVSNKETVLDSLGSPSTISAFPMEGKNCNAWYYVYRKTETTSFFDPKVVDQLIIKIILDEKEIVHDIIVQKGVNGEEIKASKERTTTTGYQTSFLKDIFGNFGRYSLDPKKDS
jgi:outer membrane protein assembly factor BamE (lipoprotein component of BamABCDE complex)